MELVFDQELEKLVPLRVGIVEVTLNDGTTLTERVDAVRGSAQNPMTREEVATKARDLMSPVLGASRTDRLITAILSLEKAPTLRSLRPLLQPSR